MIGYNNCTKRGDIKNVKEEMLPAVIAEKSFEERELERVENSVRVIQSNKKGEETNIDGFCNSKNIIEEGQHNERNEEKRARLDSMKKYMEAKRRKETDEERRARFG